MIKHVAFNDEIRIFAESRIFDRKQQAFRMTKKFTSVLRRRRVQLTIQGLHYVEQRAVCQD